MSSTARTVFESPRPSPAAARPTVREAPRLAIGTNPPGTSVDTASGASTSLASASLASPVVASSFHTPVVANQIIASAPGPVTVFLDQPAYIPPRRAAEPPRPAPSIGVALLLAMIALVIAPLAPIAWMHAAEQLELVRRGARSIAGRRVLHAVQGVGIAMTMVAVAAAAFGFTVLVVR